jgi:hypothetical protein
MFVDKVVLVSAKCSSSAAGAVIIIIIIIVFFFFFTFMSFLSVGYAVIVFYF